MSIETSVPDIDRRGSAPQRVPTRAMSGVIDRTAETVSSAPTSVSRGALVATLIDEVVETLRWRYSAEANVEELASLDRVVAEARAHAIRMVEQADLHVRSESGPG